MSRDVVSGGAGRLGRMGKELLLESRDWRYLVRLESEREFGGEEGLLAGTLGTRSVIIGVTGTNCGTNRSVSFDIRNRRERRHSKSCTFQQPHIPLICSRPAGERDHPPTADCTHF